MKRRFIATVMIAAMMLALLPVLGQSGVYAASRKPVKMTVYDQVIKSGNTVYCAGVKGIYKVRLKNGKVKSKKLIVKNMMGPDPLLCNMKKRGNRLYYTALTMGTSDEICRVDLKTFKTKTLVRRLDCKRDYVIKNKRIYYYNGFSGSSIKSMKLNGKSKKKAKSVKPVMIEKDSNAKGYSVVVKDKGDYAYDYLRTPKGKFYLGKALTD